VVGAEVLAYRSTDECLDLIAYYVKYDAERERIARAGQLRCLAEHTYEAALNGSPPPCNGPCDSGREVSWPGLITSFD
jgi:hypothetical protein